MNELIETDSSKLPPSLARLVAGQWKEWVIPLKWDGKVPERIVEHLGCLLVWYRYETIFQSQSVGARNSAQLLESILLWFPASCPIVSLKR